jgi:hypothetical protein
LLECGFKLCANKAILVDLEGEVQEMAEYVAAFPKLGLIGRFWGIWWSLHDLHWWIS